MAIDLTKNLGIWDLVEKTDPEFTKGFKRAGGFSGTAINPMYAIKKMTEVFGPMGRGWGIEASNAETFVADEEVMIFVQVSLWWGEETKDGKRFKHVVGPQWGGDFIVRKRNDGKRALDDEAYKKAMTDAMLKCMSYLGIGSDIHLGHYDDSKYVSQAEREFGVESTLPKPKPGKGAPTPTGKGAPATPAGSGSGNPDVGMMRMPEPDRDAELQEEINELQKSVDASWAIVQEILLRKFSGDVNQMKNEVKKRSAHWLDGVDVSVKKDKLLATKVGLAHLIADLKKEEGEAPVGNP